MRPDRVVSLMVWLYTCADRWPVLRRPLYWLGDSIGRVVGRWRRIPPRPSTDDLLAEFDRLCADEVER